MYVILLAIAELRRRGDLNHADRQRAESRFQLPRQQRDPLQFGRRCRGKIRGDEVRLTVMEVDDFQR